MLYIPIEFDAIPQLQDQGISDQVIRSVLIRVASRFTPIVQRSAPIDTGALRRSLRVELLLDDSGVAITSNIRYAGFVEYGTRRMRPRSYAEAVIPDLLAYANSLFSELGDTASNGMVAVPNSRELNTGEGVQRVSVESLSLIKPTVIKPRSIAPRAVRGSVVEPESVTPQELGLEFVA